MAQKLVDMGMKRKELHPTESASPTTEKDYKNEKVYPEVRLSGAHAEAMGKVTVGGRGRRWQDQRRYGCREQ